MHCAFIPKPGSPAGLGCAAAEGRDLEVCPLVSWRDSAVGAAKGTFTLPAGVPPHGSEGLVAAGN